MGATDRVGDFDYDPTGKPTRQTIAQGSSVVEIRTHYDSAGRPDTVTVENGATDLTTTFGYDQRGLRIWTLDPRGNQTDFAYDHAGRLVEEQAPSVSIKAVGGTVVSGRPTVRYGYDAVGNRVAALDPRGALTRQSFDRLDRRTRVDHPAYTPPGGTALAPFEEYGYDQVGNLVWSKDRRGQVTDYLFDARNRVVRNLDPQVAGQPTRGATLLAYDDAGNRTAQTDPTGAVVTVGYDDLNRPRTTTQIVRQTAPAGSYTTTFDYDALGRPTFQSDPSGVSTTSGYNAAGELTSVTDALNKTTTYGYDAAGRRTSEVDPLGRRTEHVFDTAGRETSTVWKAPGSGAVLATEYRTFDAAGNQTAYRSARSASASDNTYKTSYAYDAANRLTSVVQPDAAGPITTGYGYDAAGNLTRVTDGRDNTTTYTWTPWNTPESTVEPPTPGQTSTTDRTFTLTADAAGLPVTETQPAVTIGRTFDALGRLTDETGSGTGVPAATRSFGYDLAGRRVAVSHPNGTIGLGYDDRSLLLSASLPGSAQVASSFQYDPAGRLASRTDAAGTTTFAYTGRGELDVATDPLTGLTTNFDWNDAGQVATATYGTAPTAVRTYSYDARGWLDVDELKAGATTVAKADYDYDPDGNLTGQTIVAPGNPAAGATTYGYDRSGRISSATLPLPTYDKVVAASSPIGYWRLGEAAGTTAVDASGWARAGAYQNSPTLAAAGLLTGDTDTAVRFSRGVGGLLSLPLEGYVDLPALPLANASFSIEAWIAPDANPPDSQVVFGSTNTLATETLALRVRGDGRIGLGYGPSELSSAAGAVSFGTAHHVVAAYDAVTDTSTLFVDGAEVASGNQGPFTASGATFAIGRRNSTTPDTFVGTIDELAVYDRAFPAAEAALHREAGTKSTATYTADYGYDGAGNRTRAGVQTFAYDARNRLTSGAGRAYSWDARGTLNQIGEHGTPTPVGFDALGRQVTYGTVGYSYDALDRIATRGSTPFSYAGIAIDPSAIGGEAFTRTPAGDLLALSNGTTARLAGENRHGDLAWLLDDDGTVTDSRIWDPYGQTIGATGTTSPSVGYQGDYTDPASGDVWMGARWYQPDTGTFTSRDTVFGMLKTPISLTATPTPPATRCSTSTPTATGPVSAGSRRRSPASGTTPAAAP